MQGGVIRHYRLHGRRLPSLWSWARFVDSWHVMSSWSRSIGSAGQARARWRVVWLSALGAWLSRATTFYRVMDDAVRWDLDPSAGGGICTSTGSGFDTRRWCRCAAGWPPATRRTTGQPGVASVLDPSPSARRRSSWLTACTRPALTAALVDVAVLVSTSQHVRDERVAHRDHGNDRWHSRWAAAEKHYFANVRPPESFDLVVDGD